MTPEGHSKENELITCCVDHHVKPRQSQGWGRECRCICIVHIAAVIHASPIFHELKPSGRTKCQERQFVNLDANSVAGSSLLQLSCKERRSMDQVRSNGHQLTLLA